jgi:hypothetical protein
MDDRAADLGSEWKKHWREFLRTFNLLQFAPGSLFVTSLGLMESVYGGILEEEFAPPAAMGSRELDGLLADIKDLGIREVLLAVFDAGKVLPEPGVEIVDDSGEIAGIAELAWVADKVAVLTAAQAEQAETFSGRGWSVWMPEQLKGEMSKLLSLLPERKS